MNTYYFDTKLMLRVFFKSEDIYLYLIINLLNVYLVLSWECRGMYIYVHPGTWMAFRVCTFMFRLALRGLKQSEDFRYIEDDFELSEIFCNCLSER